MPALHLVKYAVNRANHVHQPNHQKTLLQVALVLRPLQIHLFSQDVVHEEKARPDGEGADSQNSGNEDRGVLRQLV